MQEQELSIRLYTTKDEDNLFNLLSREGDEWKDYWGDSMKSNYRKALNSSITYLLFEDGQLCGYARCRDDDGYGIYVYDLLVDKAYRGKEYGRILIERVCEDFPHETMYIMSDVDSYYEKLGYEKEGSIFIVTHK